MNPNFEQAPHLAELEDPANIKVAESFSRVLNMDTAPQKQYEKTGDIDQSIQKWGQRKMLLGVIEFLTTYSGLLRGDKEKMVVYAQAAPGTHIPYLLKLFPHLKFILYDYRPFDFSEEDFDNVKIIPSVFNDWIARSHAEDNILFICDLRSHADDLLKQPRWKQEKIIQEDLVRQRTWYNIMQPVKAYLKFRLPWKPGKTEYLGGTVFNQVWAGPHSTETRLIPDGTIRVYDHTTYEEQLFYFNTETRRHWYPHDYECLGHCYDCMAELFILTQFMTKVRQLRDLKKVKVAVALMSEDITKLLTKNNTTYLKPPFVAALKDI